MKNINCPKYVQECLARAVYEYDFYLDHINYAAGYTLSIRKASPYTLIDTFAREIKKVVDWANKVAGCEIAYIIDIPAKTHHVNQVAVITIFDPVMQGIEKYIGIYRRNK